MNNKYNYFFKKKDMIYYQYAYFCYKIIYVSSFIERVINVEKIAVKEIVEAVKGTLLAGNPETMIEYICIDSREAHDGGLFVPIIGEKVDAHKFIAQVFDQGAAGVFMSHGDIIDSERVHILVKDTVKALGDLAAYYRKKFDMPIVGITGSVGKTSTKEMISAALETGHTIMKTAGNQNSQIGVPLTLFRMEKNHELAVVEMGISEFGEMDNLVRFANPDVAVVTNIGEAHIAQFGKMENTMKEKLKIAANFTEKNCLFLNGDDELLRSAVKDMTCPVILYGLNEACDYRAENLHIQDGKNCFTMIYPEGREDIVIRQLGIHNVQNALVAMAVANHFGIKPEISKKGLENYEGVAMRQQMNHLERGIKVIDDTYNASPASVKSGMDVLKQLDNPGRKIAVLADILELGEASEKIHYDLGIDVAKFGIQMVVTVGEEMKVLARAIIDSGNGISVCSFDNNTDASEWLIKNIQDGDAVLVKGSRGMHEEEVVKALRDAFMKR